MFIMVTNLLSWACDELKAIIFYNRLQRFKYLQYRKLGYAVTSLPISYSDMISVIKALVVQCWKIAYLMY